MSGVFGPTLALSVVLGMIGIPPGLPAPDASPDVVTPPAPISAPVAAPSAAASPAANTGTVVPSAVASAAAVKLKEIGHVHATTEFCKTALERTNNGVLLLLENDRRIGDVQNALRSNDFDYSELSRNNGIRQLIAIFVQLRAAAVTGNGQMALLKAQLKDSPTEEQKAALLALQQAVDGALMRQKRLADRIGRMIVILENHDRVDADQQWQNEFDAQLAQNNFFAYHDPEGPLANLPQSLDTTAKNDIVDIQEKVDSITHDEGDASDRLDAAFAGCL